MNINNFIIESEALGFLELVKNRESKLGIAKKEI